MKMLSLLLLLLTSWSLTVCSVVVKIDIKQEILKDRRGLVRDIVLSALPSVVGKAGFFIV